MAWQDVAGEIVLLHIDGHELLGLNAVGGLIWQLIDGAQSIDQIALAVAREFEVSHEVAATDVRSFVAELLAMGALTLPAR
jgi:hypothetical protein